MFLVSKGVPYDVAFSYSEAMVLGSCVTLGQLEGNEFNWQSMRWVEKER